MDVLTNTSQLPIIHEGDVHDGKVRSLYWLTKEDSRRLITSRDYPVSFDSQLGVMVISDRISAFDFNWRAEGGMDGVPQKGAALNAISMHWFSQFEQAGIARHHVLEEPHPLVWIVQRTQPLYFEAIARNYLAGSMARAYTKGQRTFCGIALPEGLQTNQPLPETLLTPSTKGMLFGIPGVPEEEDTPVSIEQIRENATAFGLKSLDDLEQSQRMLLEGVQLIGSQLEKVGQIFVDTKFEFGYAKNVHGEDELVYMDEVGTPDSSRFWDAEAYKEGRIVDYCKESFRQFLLSAFDNEILLNANRMSERKELAANTQLPQEVLLDVSKRYTNIAEKITGKAVPTTEKPHTEILDALAPLGILV
ncbi:MAG: phosphoribosylaminoimidazolesuccinocarboxamide synthase [Deltaproteobacteria bacterium]|nr:phosphoribosylaminoimidazolesuccinocarboxamide synthase [Deltaproteobacteria bacterium]MBU50781.1 phosphoribosylaminoimidazolesuccinocarboxamide synthase [Deltaproteobacteria bacterium]|tara:strand:- start:105 stop:1190 length:1086 start_codon:yes stop_codon:yes gene_type:complete